MLRKKKRKYRKHREDRRIFPEWSISPETKRGVIVVLIFLFVLLSVFSMFDLAGIFGDKLHIALSYLFGWGDWLFILLVLFIGYSLFQKEKYSFKFSNYFGLSLLILGYSGIFNFFVSEFKYKEITSIGSGGGALGYLLGYFSNLLGFWGSLVVFLAFIFIGLLLGFNTSFNSIINKCKSLGILKEKILPNDEYLEYDEEEEEDDIDWTEEDEDHGDDEEIETEEYNQDNNRTEEGEDHGDDEVVQKKKVKINIPINLLTGSNTKPSAGDLNIVSQKIEKTLADFGIEVTMGEVNIGPTVTQYTFKPAEGVKLSQIATLQDDLALALAAHPLRIEAPIPGKSLVGIEVPNQSVSIVKLREMLESKEYKEKKSNLALALGRDVSGVPIIAGLDKMPHLLIAGATNSGKSVCINNIIINLLYQNSPDELKFILIDPKRVELVAFNDIPHLLTPVINDTDKVINALRWVIKEMQERYKLLQAARKKNIASYNSAVIVNKLPHIVIIIDEFSALMSLASKEIEAAVVSLAQLGRAAGVHLILATQRPSTDVITGLIKANMPTRIAFGVGSSIDSRTILDSSGAEKLLGNGDMLFSSSDNSKMKRIQGAYITDEEIKNIIDHIKEQAEPEYNDSVIEKVGGAVAGFSSSNGGGDTLIDEAKEIVLKASKASATLLQRRLRIGYPRAASLLDSLEEMGVVGPADGSKPREVLISQEDLEENFSTELDNNEEYVDEEEYKDE